MIAYLFSHSGSEIRKRDIDNFWKEMRHEEQLKLGTTTTLDEPVSETIVSELEIIRRDHLSS